jgi:hypothetical protein
VTVHGVGDDPWPTPTWRHTNWMGYATKVLANKCGVLTSVAELHLVNRAGVVASSLVGQSRRLPPLLGRR